MHERLIPLLCPLQQNTGGEDAAGARRERRQRPRLVNELTTRPRPSVQRPSGERAGGACSALSGLWIMASGICKFITLHLLIYVRIQLADLCSQGPFSTSLACPQTVMPFESWALHFKLWLFFTGGRTYVKYGREHRLLFNFCSKVHCAWGT